jgi:hypothetical protein
MQGRIIFYKNPGETQVASLVDGWRLVIFLQRRRAAMLSARQNRARRGGKNSKSCPNELGRL